MPKRVFWPIALIVMGLVFLASLLQLLPSEFANLWPIMLVIIGLGGLLTSDRDEWLSGQGDKKRVSKRPVSRAAKRVSASKPTRKLSRKR